MKKEYDQWHTKKSILNERKDMDAIFFREKEIWWVALGANVGFEQDGKGEEFRRPALILKKFNRHVVLVVPLTTKLKRGNKYYVSCVASSDTLDRMAIISQIRLVDTRRFVDKLGVVEESSYQKIKNAVKAML